MGVLLYRDISDLSTDFQINHGTGLAEQALLISNTIVLEQINTPSLVRSSVEVLVTKGFNYIIIANEENADAAFSVASDYPDIYFVIAGQRSKLPHDRIATIGINKISPFYLLGYIAGLQSHAIGLVVPGTPVENYYTTNAFYQGVMRADPTSQVYVVSTSSYNDADTANGAISLLSQQGVNIVTQSQYDNQVSTAFVANGTYSLGSNGYPQENILGNLVLQSIIHDYRLPLTGFGRQIQDNTWTANPSYYGDFNNEFFHLSKYSFLLDNEFRDKVQVVVNELMATTADKHPYLCSKSNEQEFGKECITNAEMLGMKQVYKGVVNMGYFSMPLTEVYDIRSINLAFIIVCGCQIGVAFIFICLVLPFAKRLPIFFAKPTFCLGIALGGMLVPTGILLWNLHNKTDSNCNARIWMVSLGYTFLIGLMSIKSTLIQLKFQDLIDKKSDLLSPIAPSRVYRAFAVLLVVNIVILAVYTGAGDVSAYNSLGLDGIGKYEYTQTCVNSGMGDRILYALLVFHGLQLLYGCVISWKTRIIDLIEFEETHDFSNAIYLMSFCLFIVVPLMAGISTERSQNTIISSVGIFTSFSALLIVFGSKFWKIYRPSEDDGQTQIKMQGLRTAPKHDKTSPYNHSTATKNQFLTAVVNPTGSGAASYATDDY
eukprot:gene14086-16608_t